MATRRLRDIPRRVFFRYLVLMIPGAAALTVVLVFIRHLYGLPNLLIVLVLVLWVLKDLLVFPFVWESYDVDRPGISGRVTGVEGTVIERLSPGGRVRVRGENWRAECIGREKNIEKGALVRVVRRRGLTLFVESVEGEGRGTAGPEANRRGTTGKR